nr:NADH dehydrogenase [ubiquinone] iron-sulfur protein 2 [Tanacetum cinerariifolium]GFA57224.1 NADH dehydrogenase [ubiquinone] iron-sulfur protein 2 [Tanacetum cinerariifolium]
FFLRSRFFSRPLPRHSASLPVLRKNQVTSTFFIDLGKRNCLPVGKLDIKRMRSSVRGGASGFQCTASKIRMSLSADHCRPILELGCWIRDPRSRLDQHPTERGQSLEATGAKRSAFATEKTNGQREGSRLSQMLAKLDSHSEALRVSEAL